MVAPVYLRICSLNLEDCAYSFDETTLKQSPYFVHEIFFTMHTSLLLSKLMVPQALVIVHVTQKRKKEKTLC